MIVGVRMTTIELMLEALKTCREDRDAVYAKLVEVLGS